MGVYPHQKRMAFFAFGKGFGRLAQPRILQPPKTGMKILQEMGDMALPALALGGVQMLSRRDGVLIAPVLTSFMFLKVYRCSAKSPRPFLR